jgi:hypothetical protein
MCTKQNDNEPLCLNEKQAAKSLSLCPRTLYNLRRQGRIGFVKLGAGKGRVLYPLTALQKFLAENTGEAR